MFTQPPTVGPLYTCGGPHWLTFSTIEQYPGMPPMQQTFGVAVVVVVFRYPQGSFKQLGGGPTQTRFAALPHPSIVEIVHWYVIPPSLLTQHTPGALVVVVVDVVVVVVELVELVLVVVPDPHAVSAVSHGS